MTISLFGEDSSLKRQDAEVHEESRDIIHVRVLVREISRFDVPQPKLGHVQRVRVTIHALSQSPRCRVGVELICRYICVTIAIGSCLLGHAMLQRPGMRGIFED